MNQGRIYRLTVGAITPPLLGFLPVALFVLFNEVMESVDFSLFSAFIMAGGLLVILMGSYVFAGIQSCIYSLLMEFLVLPNAGSNKVVIILSAFIGFLSGVISNILSGQPLSIGLPFIGLLVGLVTGLHLLRHYRKSVKKCLADRRVR